MLYIGDVKPSLGTGAGSIRAKLFMRRFRIRIFFFFSLLCFLLWKLYPEEPQIFYVLFHILYVRISPHAFPLFDLIMA